MKNRMAIQTTSKNFKNGFLAMSLQEKALKYMT